MQDERLARAWALKAECYEAWHREPPRTRAAADAVAALVAGASSAATPVLATLEALAAWTAGIALMAEGRLVEALERLGGAERAFESIGDEQHAAEVQVPQMGALSFLGREHDVIPLGRLALARFLARGDERSAAKVEINLGTSWSRQDRHVEAETVFRSASLRGDRLGDAYLAAMAGIGLANALAWQHRVSAALRAAARARRLARRGGHVILQAQTLEATGQMELNRGRFAPAVAAMARSLQLLERAGASPHRRLECEMALADAYAAMHLQAEAIDLYRRVSDTAGQLEAPAEAAYAWRQLGRLQARARAPEAALESFETARALYARLGHAVGLQLTALGAARLELQRGAVEAAQRMAAQGADALEAAGIRGLALEARTLEAEARAAAGHTASARETYRTTLAAAGEVGTVAGQCHAGLAALALAEGDAVAARDHALQALRRLEHQRDMLPADELRAALGDEGQGPHDTLVAASLRLGDDVQLFEDLERGRARALASGIGRGARRPAAQALTGRLVQLRQAWRAAMVDDDGVRLPALDADILRVEAALLETQRRDALAERPRRRASAGASAESVGAGAVGLAAWQRALGPARALVAYHLRGPELLALVLTADRVQRSQRRVDDLAERVSGLRLQIEAARNPALLQRHAPLLMQRLRDHARSLYEQVWQPVRERLAPGTEVVVVPHGALHDLPWAALHDGDRWFAETQRVTLAPSAAVWARLQARPRASVPRRVLAAAPQGQGLDHLVRELAAVAEAHGAAARCLQGAEATAGAIRQAAAGSLDVLHLACHARFRADNPSFSTLQLADGPLPMHELAGWRLQASLVVLSACETGVSRVAPGDEAFGLVRAVMLAGARSVLASHWAVSDRTTADLIARVHQSLREGQGPSAALQRAQAEAAGTGLHPYHWAAFAVHGAG